MIPLVYAVPTAGKSTLMGSGLATGWLETDSIATEGWPAGVKAARDGHITGNEIPAFYRAMVITVAAGLSERGGAAAGVLTNILAEDLIPLTSQMGGPELRPIAIVTRDGPETIAALLRDRDGADPAWAATIGNDAIDSAAALQARFPAARFIVLQPDQFLSDVWDSVIGIEPPIEGAEQGAAA